MTFFRGNRSTPVVLSAAGGVVNVWGYEDGVHSAVLDAVVGLCRVVASTDTGVGVPSCVGGELGVEAVQLNLVIA